MPRYQDCKNMPRDYATELDPVASSQEYATRHRTSERICRDIMPQNLRTMNIVVFILGEIEK